MDKKDRAYKISKAMGKAIFDYKMLKPEDHILLGLSGGKDSLALAEILEQWRRRAPFPFRITNIHVDMGDGTAEILADCCKDRDIPLTIQKPHKMKKAQRSPCYWCAKTRRDTLFSYARDRGCARLAFAHHEDDIAETILMNMFFNGNLSAMTPNCAIFGGNLHIIRPFAYVAEKELEMLAKERNYPSMPLCPHAARSKRALIKKLLGEMESHFPKIRGNILKSLTSERIKELYLMDMPRRQD